MLPTELQKEIITLPKTDRHTIVIVTGNGLRHKRFAYRIQKEFGDQVIAWYELDSKISATQPSSNNTTTKETIRRASKVQKVLNMLIHELPQSFSKYGLWGTLKRMLSLGTDLYYRLFFMRNISKKMTEAEKKLFGQEVNDLKCNTLLKPIRIHPNDVHGEAFINEIKKLDPYFFLTLSGPLYQKQLLDTIRGAAINQHAGHSPLLKGSNTIHWALYHRELQHVSSTIHITSTGADAGQILRRSNPCMFPNDNVETVFLRTVALGTELIIESVQDIIRNKEVMVFQQPKGIGKTYLNKEYNFHIAKSIIRDFRSGWLHNELNNQRNF